MRISAIIILLSGLASVTVTSIVSSAGAGPLAAWAIGAVCWAMTVTAAGVWFLVEAKSA